MGIFDKVKSVIGEGGFALVQEAGTKLFTEGLSGVADNGSVAHPPPVGQLPVQSDFSPTELSASPALLAPPVASEFIPAPPPTGLMSDEMGLTSVASASPGAGQVEKLLQLNEMFRVGLISREEFDLLKGKLLT